MCIYRFLFVFFFFFFADTRNSPVLFFVCTLPLRFITITILRCVFVGHGPLAAAAQINTNTNGPEDCVGGRRRSTTDGVAGGGGGVGGGRVGGRGGGGGGGPSRMFGALLTFAGAVKWSGRTVHMSKHPPGELGDRVVHARNFRCTFGA